MVRDGLRRHGTLDSWVREHQDVAEVRRLLARATRRSRCRALRVPLGAARLRRRALRPEAPQRAHPAAWRRGRPAAGRPLSPPSRSAPGARRSRFRPDRAASSETAVGGSPQYVAPEIFVGQGSERSDLFALGLMLYEFAHPGTAGSPVRAYEGRRPALDPRSIGTSSPTCRRGVRTSRSTTSNPTCRPASTPSSSEPSHPIPATGTAMRPRYAKPSSACSAGRYGARQPRVDTVVHARRRHPHHDRGQIIGLPGSSRRAPACRRGIAAPSPAAADRGVLADGGADASNSRCSSPASRSRSRPGAVRRRDQLPPGGRSGARDRRAPGRGTDRVRARAAPARSPRRARGRGSRAR